MKVRLILPISLALAGLACTAAAQSRVVTASTVDRGIEYRAAAPLSPLSPTPRVVRAPKGSGTCGVTPVAWQGQPMPDGEDGTLDPQAFFNSATINNAGTIAFVARVADADRNQGVFTADADGIHVIMLGCGGDGGSGEPGTCGDPTPIGGTFGGIFLGTYGTPAINDNGDVLFVADVADGDAPRGLFLYEAGTGEIVKIVAQGEESPLGGPFTIIGMGSVNSAGTVVFLAGRGDNIDPLTDMYLWENGVVTKYVAAGDPVPGGGEFALIGTETLGYADGTFVAGGPFPAINEAGTIAFRGIVSGVADTDRGIFIGDTASFDWLLRAGTDSPNGGTFIDFQAPSLNANGEVAFFGDTTSGSGWFAGDGASWRSVITYNDLIEGSSIVSLAFSRNPMRAIADNGDIVIWASRVIDGNERNTTLVVHPDSSITILATQGEDTGFGGIWGGSMDAFPSINNNGQVRMGSATPGFNDAISADVVFQLCAEDIPIFTDGFDGPPTN
jgi:hypothetical protein